MATVAQRIRAAHRHAGADTIERASLSLECSGRGKPHVSGDEGQRLAGLGRCLAAVSGSSGHARYIQDSRRFSVGGLHLLPACDESSGTSVYTADLSSNGAFTHHGG